VHLSNLKFALHGLETLVSGQVEVQIAFPKGINLNVLVHQVTVDLVAFDGPVPNTNKPDSLSTNFGSAFPWKPPITIPRVELPWPWDHHISKPSPPPHPVPDPLPENAFARIRPEEWLNATSVRVNHVTWLENSNVGGSGGPNNGVGTRLKVYSEFRDVPVKILPGRDHVFRKFVRKFLFNDETLTGIQGYAGVGVIIPGLLEGGEWGGDLELLDLPFDGVVYVGKEVFRD